MINNLKVNKLLIRGPGRNYEVPFYSGVNIIAGPIFTGKSSILELIDYAFGAQKPPRYPEISKCSDIFLEIQIGNEHLTIQRNLDAITSNALIHDGQIDDVLSNKSTFKEVSPKHISDQDSISSEILTRLGLLNLKVKNAPTQDASDTSTFSLRDLLSILFIDQDRMGAKKNGFYEAPFFKQNKWKAAFQICFNLFDEAIASLAKSLSDANSKKSEIEAYLKNNQDFLDKFQIPDIDTLRSQISQADITEKKLLNQIQSLNAESQEQLGSNFDLVEQRKDLVSKVANFESQISEHKRSLVQLGKLMVQYSKEKQQFDFLEESERLVGSLPITKCPSCFQRINDEDKTTISSCMMCKKLLPASSEEISVKRRSQSLNSKIKDLTNYIDELEDSQYDLEYQLENTRNAVGRIEEKLNIIEKITLLPASRKAIELNEALSTLRDDKRRAEEYLSFRLKSMGEGSNLNVILDRIRSLETQIDNKQKNLVNPDKIVSDISEIFGILLKRVSFPVPEKGLINPSSFLPQIRGQIYSELKSRGAISLVQVCWHLSLLIYSFSHETSFPQWLLFDSPLSHLGKRADDPQFKDQQIIDSFYETLEILHEHCGDEFQLIIIDNYPPPRMNYLVNVQFTRNPKQGRFGLIDDEYSLLPEA